jgi:LPS-assembly lipoprotein
MARCVAAVALIAGLAGGCGFRPLYATDAVAGDAASPAAREELAATEVAPIADRSGQILRNELVFLLGAAGKAPAARYSLGVALTETLSTVAVRITGLATRADLRLKARYTLTDLATGAVLTEGQADAVGSFDLLENEFATLIAGRYTREQAARRLARLLHMRLAAFYGTREVAAGRAGARSADVTGADVLIADVMGAAD